MLKTPNISVAILAAGGSKRMGTPKQLLEWGNSTLLKNAIETALHLQVKEVIVVLGSNYNLIEPQISTYPITIIRNKEWEQGIGKSIACVSEYLVHAKIKPEAILITLADQPLISSTYLKKMIKNFSPHKNQIIASLYNDGKKGVPVLFDKFYLDELKVLCDNNGAQSLIAKYQNHVKTLESEIDNIDIDTFEDYKFLLKNKKRNNI